MINLILNSAIPIKTTENRLYCGMAFNESNLYLCTDGLPLISQISFNGSIIKQIKTKNSYYALCYDNKNQCYWALSYNRKCIFQLNSSFQEINFMHIPLPASIIINDLGYSCCNNTLLLCSKHTIYEYSITGKIINRLSFPKYQANQSAAEFHGYLVLASSYSAHSPNIIRMTDHNHCFNSITCLPDFHQTKSMCAVYNQNSFSQLCLLTLKKSTYPYLLKYHYAEAVPVNDKDFQTAMQVAEEMTCIQTIQVN